MDKYIHFISERKEASVSDKRVPAKKLKKKQQAVDNTMIAIYNMVSLGQELLLFRFHYALCVTPSKLKRHLGSQHFILKEE